MNNTSRFTHLLGECRRQMNGAVAGSMRYYGADYGLNYGVSLPTIRSLAATEGKDHKFATYLYQQQVREIRLASLHIAQAEEIRYDDLEFWAAGIINSEVAEEAAFALFSEVDIVVEWLTSPNELLVYTALLSLSKSHSADLKQLVNPIVALPLLNSKLINSALITLLESYYRAKEWRETVDMILDSLSDSSAKSYIVEEMNWRKELM